MRISDWSSDVCSSDLYFGTDAGVVLLRDGRDTLDKLKAGDVITAVDGKAVANPRDVMRALRKKDPESKITFAVLRDKHKHQSEGSTPAPREVELLSPHNHPKHPAAPNPPPTPNTPEPPPPP